MYHIDSIILSKVRSYIEANRDVIVDDLKYLIRVPSYREDKKSDNEPFGAGPALALEKATALCEKYGMEAKRVPQCGYSVVTAAKGNDSIGLFAHCDVVGPNGNWIYTSPFEPIEKDGFIIGRGAKDDKGGVIVAIHAINAIRHAMGLPLNRGLQIILGSNEETGMQDMRMFSKCEPMPSICLVPDCEYPVCKGEKSYSEYKAVSPCAFENIVSFDSGTGRGCVVSEIKIEIKSSEALYAQLISVVSKRNDADVSQTENGLLVLTCHGVASHMCIPQYGQSALSVAADILISCTALGENDLRIIEQIHPVLTSIYGEPFGLNFYEPVFKESTFCVTAVYLQNGALVIESAPHYSPQYYDFETLYRKIQEYYTSIGWKTERLYDDVGFLYNDNEVLNLLNDIYQQLQGKQEGRDVYVTRGGTYARKLKNAYATGIETPKNVIPEYFPKGHGSVHQPDECINIEGLLNGIELTAMYLIALAGKDDCEKTE